MEREDFHLGATVYSADDRHVGSLVHVLVDSDYGLRSLVVKETGLFSGHLLSPGSFLIADEFIVPKRAVKSVNHDRVDLRLSADQVRRLKPYIQFREKGGETLGEELEDEAGVLGQGPEVPHWLEQVAEKPASQLEIDGGENVMLGRTGRKLGTVKDVLFDGDQLVGVVLLPEGLLKHEVILPAEPKNRSGSLHLLTPPARGCSRSPSRLSCAGR